MILVLGIARRLPLVPPPRIMEAVDADMPSAIVDTSALTSFRTSYIAIEELTTSRINKKPNIFCRILSIQQKQLTNNRISNKIINLGP
ncbi:hypothetical protein HanOQP8_Chr06g0215011 [Helianthus annuus]|nr:hypothetical protein HanOQP8_Chr06g0215011 [Helianthus annuus]